MDCNNFGIVAFFSYKSLNLQTFFMRYILYITLLFSMFGCSKYQSLLKNGTPAEKLEAAKKYYNNNDFVRAQPLLEELLTLYYGKAEREDVLYYYAYSHYGLSEFLLAGYYFKSFADTYTNSPKREETAYMAAVCEYHKSMPIELDQSTTKAAITSMQAFINKYPNSSYIADCNVKIDELRSRILTKAYSSAKLYYHLGEYKSAIVSLTNALDDYPDMIHRDELTYLIVESSFEYAKNSVAAKQEERYSEVMTHVKSYLTEFSSDSKYGKEVLRLKEKATIEIANLPETTSTLKNNNNEQ